jgi:hypothetical protein
VSIVSSAIKKTSVLQQDLNREAASHLAGVQVDLKHELSLLVKGAVLDEENIKKQTAEEQAQKRKEVSRLLREDRERQKALRGEKSSKQSKEKREKGEHKENPITNKPHALTQGAERQFQSKLALTASNLELVDRASAPVQRVTGVAKKCLPPAAAAAAKNSQEQDHLDIQRARGGFHGGKKGPPPVTNAVPAGQQGAQSASSKFGTKGPDTPQPPTGGAASSAATPSPAKPASPSPLSKPKRRQAASGLRQPPPAKRQCPDPDNESAPAVATHLSSLFSSADLV